MKAKNQLCRKKSLFSMALVCVALLIVVSPFDVSFAQNLAIGTTSVGSAPYVVSVGIAEMITKEAKISTTAESSGGAALTIE